MKHVNGHEIGQENGVKKTHKKSDRERQTRNQRKIRTKQKIGFPFVGNPGKQRL